MLNPEQFEQSVETLVNLHLNGQTREAIEVEKEAILAIYGTGRIELGEEFDSDDYHRRIEQYTQYHKLVGARLVQIAQESQRSKLLVPAVNQISKALHTLWHFQSPRFRELDQEGTVLYVDRPEYPPDLDHISGGIEGVLRRRGQVYVSIQKAKETITDVLSPIMGIELSATTYRIIVPYYDQLVEIQSEDYEVVYGELVGVDECVVNIGLTSVDGIHLPLRIYPNNAYRRWCLALQLEPSGGLLKRAAPPKGIDKDLAGLSSVYLPIEDLSSDDNYLRYNH